ncbi:MAG: hypothetical protein U0T77_02645 [Chitinophagales bacterium]
MKNKHVTFCVELGLNSGRFHRIFTSATDTCLEAKTPPNIKTQTRAAAAALFLLLLCRCQELSPAKGEPKKDCNNIFAAAGQKRSRS